MTLRHLEIFLAVAETGSMRKAAEQLYISQPTVSGAIREMEEEYDVLLFERLNQRLFITPEGRQLTIYARELLSLFHEMEYTLRHSSDHAILRIGATLTVGTCVLPEILRQLEEEKHIPTSVQVAPSCKDWRKEHWTSALWKGKSTIPIWWYCLSWQTV